MAVTGTRALQSALDDLVHESVLSDVQARAVLDAVAAQEPAAETAPAPARSPLSRLLVEAAAYLGAALVAASAVAFVLQRWDSMAEGLRLALLLGLGAVGLLAGAVVVNLVGGRRALRDHEHAAQRRLASVLLTSGAVAIGVGVGQLLPQPEDTGWRNDIAFGVMLGALIVLLITVLAHWLAPSAVTELVLFGSSVLLLTRLTALTYPEVPEDIGWFGDSPPPAHWYEYTGPVAVLLFGLVWAVLVARRLTLPLLATCVGAGAAFLAAASLAADDRTRTVGLALLAVLALGGIGLFVLDRSWPWLALTVASTTGLVFFAVLGSGDAPVAFLASGLVLLAGSGLAAWLGRRAATRAVPSTAGESLEAQTTTRTSDMSGT